MIEALMISRMEHLTEARRQALALFAAGFLILFLELTCIRWFTSYVIFLQFFTNIALLAAFLGMSCGCLAAGRPQDWLGRFPAIALLAVLAALMTFAGYRLWSGYWSPQEVFFDTDYRDPDLAKFVIPIEAIAAMFFILIALMFVGLGQVLGRAFDTYPNRILGYTLNIGGSIAGILAFSLLSFAQAPPVMWFLVSCGGVAFLMHQAGSLTQVRGVLLIALVVGIGIPVGLMRQDGPVKRWSPYYMIDHDANSGSISVNNITHQQMVSVNAGGGLYALVYLLQRDSGGALFDNVLVIGAGSGNDAANALKFGAKTVDAVEIDPVVQDIGNRYHPDRPNQDARVTAHLDDGRHFLRTTQQKYDLVVYSKVDSLLLHSSYANIRLESFLFTQEAFADVRRVLKPGGMFVMYNVFRQDWIVQRIASMAEGAFGCRPTVLTLPSMFNSVTMTIAGCNPRIADAFKQHATFWLDPVPVANLDFNGFSAPAPDRLASRHLEPITATSVTVDHTLTVTTDDWPFLYLQGRLIPDFTQRSMVLLGVIGLGMVYLFLPAGRLSCDSRMFFLGAAFMLLETRAVTQMALLFGSTWLVNSSVFFSVLWLILLANIYVIKIKQVHLLWHYLGLMVFLGIGATVPPDLFFAGGTAWRYIAPCALVLSPVFFAGVIFATSFQKAPQPHIALASNIAGAVVGGIAESLSMLLGFQHLLLVAALFYGLLMWSRRGQMAAAHP